MHVLCTGRKQPMHSASKRDQITSASWDATPTGQNPVPLINSVQTISHAYSHYHTMLTLNSASLQVLVFFSRPKTHKINCSGFPIFCSACEDDFFITEYINHFCYLLNLLLMLTYLATAVMFHTTVCGKVEHWAQAQPHLAVTITISIIITAMSTTTNFVSDTQMSCILF